jgi:succinate dehydrogenase/fumarate reductase flavoprotein subunit
LKQTAIATGGGLIAGAVPLAGIPNQAEGMASTLKGRVPGYCGEGDWLGTPPVIPDSQTTKTIETDVLVLGGGHAGLMAALGATDLGARVTVIETQAEKDFEGYWGRVGEDIGHVNSKWLLNRGYGPYDTGEIVTEFVKRAAGRCNPEIIHLYVQNSGAMFDRMVEVYEEYEDIRKTEDSAVEFTYSDGVTEIYDFSNMMSEEMLYNQVQKGVAPEDYPIEVGGYKTWPCVAQFQGPIIRREVDPFISALRWFQKYHVRKTIDQGAEWHYETTAVVLTQDDSGSVTGAIVKNAKGDYIKLKARGGVVMASGGFIGNADMCWALLNESQEWSERASIKKEEFRFASKRKGDGHKMACWAGAMIEPSPRGHAGPGLGIVFPWGLTPMLLLNANAKRFCNEAVAPTMVASAKIRQPRGIICNVTDRKFMQSVTLAGVEHGGPNYGRPEWFEDMQTDMANVLAAGAKGYQVRGIMVAERTGGTVFGANTLEELAGYLGYTGDLVKTFVDTIGHYNKLCYKGIDSDFGKDAKTMIPIDKPPYYGGLDENDGTMAPILTTTAGIVTDNRLRALNKAGDPIKGLFMAGNTLGGLYGLGYSTPITGNNIGMALTHGWLAGKFAAGA